MGGDLGSQESARTLVSWSLEYFGGGADSMPLALCLDGLTSGRPSKESGPTEIKSKFAGSGTGVANALPMFSLPRLAEPGCWPRGSISVPSVGTSSGSSPRGGLDTEG